MWRPFGVSVVVGLACACTTPNPKSCADGACSDPALPFCDVDGAIGGSPMACIAVACNPTELIACRGDSTITCNGSGTNYDVAACPHGCDAAVGGCLSCSTNEHCESAMPICEPSTSVCRVCTADDECESRVCDDGRCIDQSEIVYAATDGSASAACSQAAPCTFMRAVAEATSSTSQPIIRLLPGTYAAGIEILAPTSTPLQIVGSGAFLEGINGGLRVGAGGNISIRGVTITSHLTCGAGQMAQAKLRIEDSLLIAEELGTVPVTSTNCRLTMSAVEIRGTAGQAGAIAPGSDTIFEGDRLRVHSSGMGTLGIQPLGSRITMRITNSILEDVFVAFPTFDSQPPGSRMEFGFNTFVMRRNDNGIGCESNSGSAHRISRFENNIMFAPGVASAVTGNDCYLVNNVITPQVGPALGNIVMDPQFADVAGNDFRLRPTSPAIGAALGAPTITSDHDFIGTSRPQGAAPDIGAYEQ